MIDVCTKSSEKHKELAAFVEWNRLKETEVWQGDKLFE